MKRTLIFRLACLVALWLILSYMVVASQPFNLRVAFVIIASGIIVFVPFWKKYLKESAQQDEERKR
ncbi:MAG: hypothetical protein HDS15_01325 [Bacteroides sp.]|nr:hypothetical protein [Bacteroides sp.]